MKTIRNTPNVKKVKSVKSLSDYQAAVSEADEAYKEATSRANDKYQEMADELYGNYKVGKRNRKTTQRYQY